jgi:hypothetical protein
LDDPELQEEIGEEIAELQVEMEKLRKEIGPYVMTFVRAVFPQGMLDVWGRLEAIAISSGPADVQRWTKMLAAKGENAPQRNIFSRLQKE